MSENFDHSDKTSSFDQRKVSEVEMVAENPLKSCLHHFYVHCDS